VRDLRTSTRTSLKWSTTKRSKRFRTHINFNHMIRTSCEKSHRMYFLTREAAPLSRCVVSASNQTTTMLCASCPHVGTAQLVMDHR
jgi:hypothetical protein